MTTHRESRFIAVPPDRLFALIADVESYPQFLSLWRSARVFARQENTYYTEQEIGLGPIRERFVTCTRLSPPERIDVTSDDALFRTFLIAWTLTPQHSGCRVTIDLTWDTRSRPLQKAIHMLLPTVARTMVSAFESRARQNAP